MLRGRPFAEDPRAHERFVWTSAAHTHTGLVRTINEDACLDQAARGRWAVADGMGGHACGEVASRWVIDGLAALPPGKSLEALLEAARDRLQGVNRELRGEAARRRLPIIGSTVAALFSWGRRCGYLWAGDSRIYLLRRGELIRLTRDHTCWEEIKGLVDETSEVTVQRPPLQLITRAVGAAEGLALEAGVIEVSDGDVFLLCSDGLTNEVHESEIQEVLACADTYVAARALLKLALARGGHDNITIVVTRGADRYDVPKTLPNFALS